MSERRVNDKTVAERIVGASAVTATVTLVGGVLMVGGQPASAATLVVDTLSDNPADGVTFREALAASADGDTITFDSALFTRRAGHDHGTGAVRPVRGRRRGHDHRPRCCGVDADESDR